MRKARSNAILTGLPDGYGRGRIIGDYRRIALYGVDQLIEWKVQDKLSLGITMNEENMRTREELSDQIRALNELKHLVKDMDLIFLNQLLMQKKLFNILISVTLLVSRIKMELLCLSVVLIVSSIFT